jgi:hypothetical protein
LTSVRKVNNKSQQSDFHKDNMGNLKRDCGGVRGLDQDENHLDQDEKHSQTHIKNFDDSPVSEDCG